MKKNRRVMLLIFNFIFILFPNLSCGGDKADSLLPDANVQFTLTLNEIVSSSSATCTVDVIGTNIDKLTYVDKGLCYSMLNETPDLSDDIFVSTSNVSIESFSLNLDNLKGETWYYVRPFIRTKEKVFYGYAKKFRTLGASLDYYPTPSNQSIPNYDDYRLIWADEFYVDGEIGADWTFETGFVRNEELQWYQSDNATVENGCLVITGRKERVINPNYVSSSSDWKENRSVAEYTSSSLTTSNSRSFKYGRFEVRAKIPVETGAWPAIWTLGNRWEWPLCGEIDLMEYYLKNGVPTILANACWGSNERWKAIWDESTTPLSSFINKDPNWVYKFHVWRMDWDEEYIRLYLDDVLLNEIVLSGTQNLGWDSNFINPFSNSIEGSGQYLILNLALGGNGGTPDDNAFPIKYKIDYVRVYQK